MKLTKSNIIRGLLIIMILFSMLATFVSKIILHDYQILTNSDGLPTLDE